MDLCRFINSKDIREHLKSIGYRFSTPEAAFLVWQCHDATLEEKFAAWQEITDTMPDCSMEQRLNMESIDSLHIFLRKYMELQRRSISRFHAQDQAVYFYSYHCREDEGWCEDFEQAFTDYEACLVDYKKQCDDTIEKVVFKKQWLNRPEKYEKKIEIVMNENLEPLSVEESHLSNDEYEVDSAFEGMWFSFPTPFRRGDILFLKPGRYCRENNPFILDSLDTWTADEMKNNGFGESEIQRIKPDLLLEKCHKSGDTSDMNARGYFVDDDGSLYYKVECSYLNLERYDKDELPGETRILRIISGLLTGKVGWEFLSNAHHLILVEEEYQKLKKKYSAWYTKEALEELGIEKDKDEH